MSIFNNVYGAIAPKFELAQSAISDIGNLSSGVDGLIKSVKNLGSFSSPTASSPLPSGTISIPTGNGDVIISSQPQTSGFGIDTSNPLVLVVGAVIIGKLLKIF